MRINYHLDEQKQNTLKADEVTIDDVVTTVRTRSRKQKRLTNEIATTNPSSSRNGTKQNTSKALERAKTSGNVQTTARTKSQAQKERTNEIASTESPSSKNEEKRTVTKRKRDESDNIEESKSKINRTIQVVSSDVLIAKQSVKNYKAFYLRSDKSKMALMPTIQKHELVWAYIKSFPSWPGVVEDITKKGKYLIHFFGDYTRAEVTRRFICNYFEGFSEFACNFGNNKLRKAVEEAKYFLLGNNDTTECYVCKVLAFKRQLMLNREINQNVPVDG